jgi:crotonobetainyl-CoA:carnitine CoA-transferase CaiB-like acyl-CoA transferase
MMLQGVFATAEPDRWIALTIRDDRDWKALVALTDGHLAEFAHAGADARCARAPEIRARVAEWTELHQVGAILDALVARGVPAGEVLTERQVLADAHLESRRWLQRRSHPETGEHLYPGRPWLASDFVTAWGRPFPALGEDNEYVYRTVMGYTDAEYKAAIAAGNVGVERVR